MELTKNQEEKLNTWSNLFAIERDPDEKWVIKNHKKIYDMIQKKYDNVNTKKNHLLVLISVFKHNNKLTALTKKHQEETLRLNKEATDKAKKQLLKPNRMKNFVCYENLVDKRKELYDKFVNDKKNNKVNLQMLVLALYTMQPPIRQEYKDMLIVKTPLKKDDKKNYLLKKNGKYTMVIKHDKVIKSHKVGKFELSDELGKIIDLSLEAYPRKYVLPTINNPLKPTGKQGLERLLHGIFHGKRLSVDLLRIAYITHAYEQKGINALDKEKLAKLMRHSISTAQNNYHKINVDCSDDEDDDENGGKIKEQDE